jgi:hypothetical protein
MRKVFSFASDLFAYIFVKPLPRSVALLVVVIIIFAIMLILPHLAGSPKSHAVETRVRLEQMAEASRSYFANYGSWPTGIANFYRHGNAQHLLFIADVPTATNDAWNYPIHYQPFDAAVGYGKAASLGRDGKVGGAGMDRDIEVRFTTNK